MCIRDSREGARIAAVRDDAIHAVPGDALRRYAPAVEEAGAAEDRAAQASGRQGRGRGRYHVAANGARHRDCRSAPAGGRPDEQFPLNALPEYKRGLHLAELEAAEAAGVDALFAIYHPDHRDLCAHERDWPFKIVNILDVVGESMGLHHDDHFKRLKIMQDADAIVADCKDLMSANGVDPAMARDMVVKVMLADQPLPLGRPAA